MLKPGLCFLPYLLPLVVAGRMFSLFLDCFNSVNAVTRRMDINWEIHSIMKNIRNMIAFVELIRFGWRKRTRTRYSSRYKLIGSVFS